MDLLKTSQVPMKLLSRPPVRFLHDVISLVLKNTGYGKDVFTEKELDYSQLVSKSEKSEYLLKIINLVQNRWVFSRMTFLIMA